VRQTWHGTYGEAEKVYNILVRKHEGKDRLLGPRNSWVYNIKINLPKVEWDRAERIFLAQDWDKSRAVGNTVKNRSGSTKCREISYD
jgi:hypothetical protein